MSISCEPVNILICDICKRSFSKSYNIISRPFWVVRRLAKNKGWNINKGRGEKDICPKCEKRKKREMTDPWVK